MKLWRQSPRPLSTRTHARAHTHTHSLPLSSSSLGSCRPRVRPSPCAPARAPRRAPQPVPGAHHAQQAAAGPTQAGAFFLSLCLHAWAPGHAPRLYHVLIMLSRLRPGPPKLAAAGPTQAGA
eukprot:1158508-Pelagomonas_calceolata.AAC.17